MPPVLATAYEEGLDTHLSALRGQREYVGIAHTLRVDCLAALDEGRGSQPVAQDSGSLEIEILSRLGHLGFEVLLHLARLAGEEVLRLPDKRRIIFLADPVDARRAAPLDLVEQARAIAPAEETVGA